MTNLPADLSPEAAAWLLAQNTIANARMAATMRQEMNKLDDWTSGIFVALRDLLFHQLLNAPELAHRLSCDWRLASGDFERVQAGLEPRGREGSLDKLEAPHLLYTALTQVGVMPLRGQAK